jgi:Alpha/beta hydrolase domain
MIDRPQDLSLPSMLVGSLAIVPAMVAVGVLVIMTATTQTAQARVTRIVVNERISPAFNGRSFGTVGQYEQLNGIAYGEVDPQDPQNVIIQDIGLAPRNRDGKVEYSMDISILKPLDSTKGNHVLLYDVVNRGRKLVTGFFNIGATAANLAGDGFLENEGFTLVWSGWQADLVPSPGTGQIAMTVPVADAKDGGILTGTVRSEITSVGGFGTFTAPIQTSPIFGGVSIDSRGYRPVSADTSKATLTQRVHAADVRELIAASQWAFGSCNPAFRNVVPDAPDAAQFHICKQGGFDPNHIYELIYQAQDPLVLGLGFASTRDFVSFLHHSNDAQNPVAGTIQYTLLHGTSQSGRYARSFLQLGFNRDEGGRIVFEGMNPHIASARIALNIRFGQPGRGAGLQHTERDYAGLESPMTWSFLDDPLAKIGGALLARCRETSTCPKIVQTVTDTEYWQTSMSSDTTDVSGQHDLIISDGDGAAAQPVSVGGIITETATRDRTLSANVRLYHLASTQHAGYPAVAPVPPPANPVCQQLPNANSYTYNLRALLIALKRWVVEGKAPPESRYPRISDGTLVEHTKLAFPSIPKVSKNFDVLLNRRAVYNRGAEFDSANVSGYESVAPPARIADYVALVPQVNTDGNDIGGVHSLSLMVPLGTYTGWNTRVSGFGEGDACDLIGSFIAFPKTAVDAASSGDPRKSIANRYPSTDAYDVAVTAAARTLVSQGFLLATDEASAVSQVKTQARASGLLPP